MGIDQFEIVKYPSPILGLSGETTMAYGSINLAVKAGTVTRVTEFVVVDRPASYNVIMGTPWLNAMRAIPSTYHLCLKFPTPNGIEVIWGNTRVSQGGATVDRGKPRNDLLVIELTIRDIDVARVLIDTGSSDDIIFKDTLEKMGIDQFEIVKYPSPLLGLSGETTMAYGSINLAVKARIVTRVTEFLVVDHSASYNVIMGTPWLNAMRAISSTYHLCLKFPTPNGIKVIWGNPRVSQVCYAAEQKRKRPDREIVPRKTKKKVSDQGSLSQD
ncbi:hypothetical protein F2Q69_00036992 [Brassica cretica]|uniref:Peptidase A2 domain-containing protein n=1 Tax=Brassica cretica TaxID=69181 RepID=A0A8S9SJX9_BRACR|nr:hypothetical protein F2Q69_00036992 [Brassica cretica]